MARYRRYDRARVAQITRKDPLWGNLPCRRCGRRMRHHRWISVDPVNNFVHSCSET